MCPTTLTSVLIALLAGQGSAPAKTPDFAGRWSVVRSAAGERGATPGVNAADELLVTQNALSLTVEHRTPGEYPKAATHRFGSGGTVAATGAATGLHVFWFGSQLVISSTSRGPVDADGKQRRDEYGEMWSLDEGGRLIIDVTERSSGRGSGWTLVYERRHESQQR